MATTAEGLELDWPSRRRAWLKCERDFLHLMALLILKIVDPISKDPHKYGINPERYQLLFGDVVRLFHWHSLCHDQFVGRTSREWTLSHSESRSGSGDTEHGTAADTAVSGTVTASYYFSSAATPVPMSRSGGASLRLSYDRGGFSQEQPGATLDGDENSLPGIGTHFHRTHSTPAMSRTSSKKKKSTDHLLESGISSSSSSSKKRRTKRRYRSHRRKSSESPLASKCKRYLNLNAQSSVVDGSLEEFWNAYGKWSEHYHDFVHVSVPYILEQLSVLLNPSSSARIRHLVNRQYKFVDDLKPHTLADLLLAPLRQWREMHSLSQETMSLPRSKRGCTSETARQLRSNLRKSVLDLKKYDSLILQLQALNIELSLSGTFSPFFKSHRRLLAEYKLQSKSRGYLVRVKPMRLYVFNDSIVWSNEEGKFKGMFSYIDPKFTFTAGGTTTMGRDGSLDTRSGMADSSSSLLQVYSVYFGNGKEKKRNEVLLSSKAERDTLLAVVNQASSEWQRKSSDGAGSEPLSGVPSTRLSQRFSDTVESDDHAVDFLSRDSARDSATGLLSHSIHYSSSSIHTSYSRGKLSSSARDSKSISKSSRKFAKKSPMGMNSFSQASQFMGSGVGSYDDKVSDLTLEILTELPITRPLSTGGRSSEDLTPPHCQSATKLTRSTTLGMRMPRLRLKNTNSDPPRQPRPDLSIDVAGLSDRSFTKKPKSTGATDSDGFVPSMPIELSMSRSDSTSLSGSESGMVRAPGKSHLRLPDPPSGPTQDSSKRMSQSGKWTPLSAESPSHFPSATPAWADTDPTQEMSVLSDANGPRRRFSLPSRLSSIESSGGLLHSSSGSGGSKPHRSNHRRGTLSSLGSHVRKGSVFPVLDRTTPSGTLTAHDLISPKKPGLRASDAISPPMPHYAKLVQSSPAPMGIPSQSSEVHSQSEVSQLEADGGVTPMSTAVSERKKVSFDVVDDEHQFHEMADSSHATASHPFALPGAATTAARRSLRAKMSDLTGIPISSSAPASLSRHSTGESSVGGLASIGSYYYSQSSSATSPRSKHKDQPRTSAEKLLDELFERRRDAMERIYKYSDAYYQVYVADPEVGEYHDAVYTTETTVSDHPLIQYLQNQWEFIDDDTLYPSDPPLFADLPSDSDDDQITLDVYSLTSGGMKILGGSSRLLEDPKLTVRKRADAKRSHSANLDLDPDISPSATPDLDFEPLGDSASQFGKSRRKSGDTNMDEEEELLPELNDASLTQFESDRRVGVLISKIRSLRKHLDEMGSENKELRNKLAQSRKKQSVLERENSDLRKRWDRDSRRTKSGSSMSLSSLRASSETRSAPTSQKDLLSSVAPAQTAGSSVPPSPLDHSDDGVIMHSPMYPTSTPGSRLSAGPVLLSTIARTSVTQRPQTAYSKALSSGRMSAVSREAVVLTPLTIPPAMLSSPAASMSPLSMAPAAESAPRTIPLKRASQTPTARTSDLKKKGKRQSFTKRHSVATALRLSRKSTGLRSRSPASKRSFDQLRERKRRSAASLGGVD